MPEEPRNFFVDDTFTIFLKEEGRDLPYFAAQISDISQVQEDVKQNQKNKRKVKGGLYEEIHKNHTCNLNYSRNHNWHNVLN